MTTGTARPTAEERSPANQPGQPAAEDRDPAKDGEKGEESPPEDSPKAQTAWDTQRDLHRHRHRSLRFDGINHGVVADRIMGDVIYQFGSRGPTHASGEIAAAELDALAERFVTTGPGFSALRERLREDRVLILTGAPFSGRRTAALMLLHALGARPVNAVDRETPPDSLVPALNGARGSGYIICDLAVSSDAPLRETHVLALRDHLHAQGGHLVITTGLRPWVEDDVRTALWEPPHSEVLLRSFLERDLGPETAARAMDLPEVIEFLPRGHQPREVIAHATAVARHIRGDPEADIRRASLDALVHQVQEWFETDEDTLHLREKAFLIALAVFDSGPYALTAELSDRLFSELQRTANARVPDAVPVFGTHIGKRLRLARAHPYPEEEPTEWGPVLQVKAKFVDPRTAPVVIREVWTGHPSARPALVAWLGRLVEDRRPFVRTRAAATVAALAATDLPSAMALVIEPWALAKDARRRVGAVSALSLAHASGAPNIFRVVDDWTSDEDARRSWVGIRAQGLLGSERPEKALFALRVRARQVRDDSATDQEVEGELAQSVELLLLSEDAGDRVMAEILRTLDDHRSAFRLSLLGFLGACRHSDDATGQPLVLRWYATAPAGTPPARGIPLLWRRALGDRSFSEAALGVLSSWVLAADADEAAEWALAALLGALVETSTDHHRIAFLLQTVRGDDGGDRPAVASRLLSAIARP
ncbi:hypothetical protein [Streptomyces sp. NPDC012888]|uniref:hypothetical protein n=1 Tax=Streptomyces sp. NPDC012888 TaxID=3364855 RepID=UPI0036A98A1F